MGTAIKVNRGSGGKVKVTNSIPLKVLSEENIKKNTFVERVYYKELLSNVTSVTGFDSFDGENIVAVQGKKVFLYKALPNGSYSLINSVTVTPTLSGIKMVNDNTAIAWNKETQQNYNHYWYVLKLDFTSGLANITYTSERYSGGNTSFGFRYNVKVEPISQNKFLFMLTLSDQSYGSAPCMEFSMYELNSVGKPVIVKQWAKVKSATAGYVRANTLGKFRTGEDANGKYALYWVQISYGDNDYYEVGSQNPIVNWVHLSLKIYENTGNYEVLYSNISVDSSKRLTTLLPGLYKKDVVVIKNTLVNLQVSTANIVKFNSSQNIPSSNSPSILNFTSGTIDGGHGSKYDLCNYETSLLTDDYHFMYETNISGKLYISIGKISATSDYVEFKFLKLFGPYDSLNSNIKSALQSGNWSLKNKGITLAIAFGDTSIVAISLNNEIVKKSTNEILGITNLEELYASSIGEISILDK